MKTIRRKVIFAKRNHVQTNIHHQKDLENANLIV